jgi:uncharacterized protein YoxC
MEAALFVLALLIGIVYYTMIRVTNLITKDLKEKNDKIESLATNLVATIKHTEALTTEHNKLVKLIHDEINAAKEADAIHQAMISNHIGEA